MSEQQKKVSAESDSSVKTQTSKEVAVQRKAGFGLSVVWIVPFLALILTGWLIWKQSFDVGPKIVLHTVSADGIEAGKTMVKFRSVNVGVVTEVSLSEDYKSTMLSVQMNKGTENMLHPDTEFWIVKPRFEHTGITGLDTLLSGPYVQMQLGSAEGFSYDFNVRTNPPVNIDNDKGVEIFLFSDDSKRISNGETVYFRGFNVGKVVDSSFEYERRQIRYTIFVREPFSSYINERTRFWVSSGLNFEVNSSGLTVNTESFVNMLSGGISFDNFTFSSDNPVYEIEKQLFKDLPSVPDRSSFILYSKKDDAKRSLFNEGLQFVIFTDPSVATLSVGTDVFFNGIKIGEVVKAPLVDSFKDIMDNGLLPALLSLYTFDIERDEMISIIKSYLRRNMLCAKVGAANPILAIGRVDLFIDSSGKCSPENNIQNSFSLNEIKDGIMYYKNYAVLPTVAGSSVIDQVNEALANISRFDMQGFSDELQNSLRAFSEAMKAFTDSNSEIERTQVIAKLAEAFNNFNKSVKNYGPDSEVYQSLKQSLGRIEQFMQDLSPAVSEFGQNPRSLLFGGEKDPEPKAAVKNK